MKSKAPFVWGTWETIFCEDGLWYFYDKEYEVHGPYLRESNARDGYRAYVERAKIDELA